MTKFQFLDNRFRKQYDFNVLYVISYECNYRCPYCFEEYILKQKKQSELLDKDIQFFEYLTSLYSDRKNKCITLYGGEPFFILKNRILSFIEKFITDWKFVIVTNLSVTSKRLKEVLKFPSEKIDFIVSLHFHRANLESFTRKLDMVIENGNDVTLRLMFEKGYRKQILLMINRYYQKYDNLKVLSRKMYDWKHNFSDTYYTDLEFYKEMSQKYPELNFYVMVDNKKIALREFIESPLNNFKGWYCDTYYKSIVLDADGTVYLCETAYMKDTYKLCNIYTDNITCFHRRDTPVVCPLGKCQCELFLNKRCRV